jgi:hypothetical protein
MAFGLVVLGYANVYDVTCCHQLQALPISHLVSDMLSIVWTLTKLTAETQSWLVSELKDAMATVSICQYVLVSV